LLQSNAQRVLHVMRMRQVSGSEGHLLELVAALRSRGWISDVLIPSPAPSLLSRFAEELAAHGGVATVVRMRSDLSPQLALRLARRLRSGRYAVAHAHLVHADWHLAVAGVAAPDVPLVSTKHNHDPFRTRAAFSMVERLAARRYARVIAISRSLAAFTERWAGVPATTVMYGLPAGPEPARVRPVGRRADVVAVGRLEPQKGFDVLLRAMPAVLEEIPHATLRIAGDGSDRRRLEALIGMLDISGSVTLSGRREDVPALLGDADLFVHSARWEGFGLVLLEAMRAGLPIVATRVGAIPEVVADGVTARLVAPDDPPALAAAIVGFLEDPAAAQATGAAGFERLAREFSPQRMAQATEAVYLEALQSQTEIGIREARLTFKW
jgi:glycosyltransferase involved in cell wall biosynthesis